MNFLTALVFVSYLVCVADIVHAGLLRIYPQPGIGLYYTGEQSDVGIGEAIIHKKVDLKNGHAEFDLATVHTDLLKLVNQSIYFAHLEEPTTLISVGEINPAQGVPITFGRTIRFETTKGSNSFYVGVQQDGSPDWRATIIGMETEGNKKIDMKFSEILQKLVEQVKKPIFRSGQEYLLLSVEQDIKPSKVVEQDIKPNGVSITFGIAVQIKTNDSCVDAYAGALEDNFNGQATITGTVGSTKDLKTIQTELLNHVNKPLFGALTGRILLSVKEVSENNQIVITYGRSVCFDVTNSLGVKEYYLGREQDGKRGQITVYGMETKIENKMITINDIDKIKKAFILYDIGTELFVDCARKVLLAVETVDENMSLQITYGTPVYFTATRGSKEFYVGTQEENKFGEATIIGKTEIKSFPVAGATLDSLTEELNFVKKTSLHIFKDAEDPQVLLDVKQVDGAVVITYRSI